MTLTCPVDTLRDAVALALPAANGRTMPVLGCLKLDAAAGGLTIAATDGEVWVRVRVDASGEGEALVPGDRLAAILRESTGEVRLEAHKSGLTVTDRKSVV